MAEFKPNYGNSASQNTLSSNDADDTARTPQVINVPHQHKNQGIDNKIPGICVEDTSQLQPSASRPPKAPRPKYYYVSFF